MSKYLFCIIIGIILFVLWNNYDGFSVGIDWRIQVTDLARSMGGGATQLVFPEDQEEEARDNA
jgi:hypothetical protein